jgi:hypothetical protein
MTAVAARAWRGEVVREVDEYCAGNVAGAVLRVTPAFVLEL